MYIYIEDKQFWLEYDGFPEKISHLKKLDKIKFKIHLYDNGTGQQTAIEFNDKLNFINSLKIIPETIYTSKSDYYWWCFDGCVLLDKKVYEDKDYYDYKGRDIKKWNIEFTLSYKDIWGSNKKTVLQRDIKLKKLLNE
jgi:hypothetical protein